MKGVKSSFWSLNLKFDGPFEFALIAIKFLLGLPEIILGS